MAMATITRAANLLELRKSGWVSKSVKQEIYDNFMQALSHGEDLFPGIIGYDSTVIPEINIGLIAGHDLLFLGEKGQAKSRLMRLIGRFLDPELPYLDIPGCPVHEDPYRPITGPGPADAGRVARGQGADRLVAARSAVRRAAGAGDEVRRRDRRDRSGPAGRRDEHVGQGGAALRLDSPHAPGHFCDERAAGARRTGPSRPVQHSRGARRANPRLSGALRDRRADPLFRQSGHLQPQRQGDSPTEGPHRLRHPHPLSARSGDGHRDYPARGGDQPGWGFPGHGALLHARDCRRDQQAPRGDRSTSTSSRA